MIAPTDGALVLIIDDEPANIHVLANALKERYELIFATSAARALEIVLEAEVDLILLDVVMPGLDGYELLEKLKQQETTRDIPVIFVTARDEVEDEERGFALGAVDYIAKPISAPIVRARVRTHLELKRQRDLQARNALLDGLTGIGNRRSFDERIERDLRMVNRVVGPPMLILVDVDHFKQYNDHYGHLAGDRCLQQIAGALDREFSRAGDLVARFGGEEFVVLLRQGDLPGQIGRSLQAVRKLEIEHARSPVAPIVTISLGALQLQSDSSAAVMLAAADVLLYQAKNEGRNRGIWRDPEGIARSVHELREDRP